MKLFSTILISLILALFFSSCGYHLVGYGSALPPHIRTVAIPVFKNSSPEPNIHREATQSVRQTFIMDGRLKLVASSQADLLIKAKLTDYQLRAVSFTGSDVADEYIVRLGVQIEAFDQVRKKVLVSQKFVTQWDYRATSGVIDSETSRFAALKEAYDELGSQLVSIIIEQF